MTNKKFHIESWHKIAALLLVLDIFAVNASFFLALWLRFDLQFSSIPNKYLSAWKSFTLIYTAFSIVVFWFLRLYHSLWRYASYNELARAVLASIITNVFHFTGITLLFRRMPVSYFLFGSVFQLVCIVGFRFTYRFVLFLRNQRSAGCVSRVSNRVMIIGAGSAGQTILRDIRRTPGVHDNVVCFIDDDANKWNRYIDGVRIVGGRDDILKSVDKYVITKIYVAMPSVSAETRRDILNICKETGCELKNLPGLYQFVLGDISVSALKPVAIEDLLGREPICVNMEDVFNFISGKVILVTGGGGSIGSELSRQIAVHGPKQLIIFDIYENNTYAIQMELRKNYPDLDLVVLIGSVRDSRRIFDVFREYHPDVVYHAAAHKHVPLMEDSPCEAIKNNVIGTYKTAFAAMVNGTKRFVLISTDKAVNPTNIMGASKRLCEMIIQSFDSRIKAGKASETPQIFTHEDVSHMREKKFDWDQCNTEFVAVRFGNVLGSNGSVIPLFRKQIEDGGPVTVTHPDIIRYFMTIPEAVGLVLQAGTYAKVGEIFVLDMGEPVKIDTLARNLIKLSGLKPDVDIKIVYSGLRPGEKLYEEKLMAEEGLKKTENDLIHIGCPIPFDTDEFLDKLERLMDTAYRNDEKDIRACVGDMVSTYRPAGQV